MPQGHAAQGRAVPADRPALPGHRPGRRGAAGGRRRGAGSGSGSGFGSGSGSGSGCWGSIVGAGSPPHRLRDLRGLQAGEHAALLGPAGHGGGGRDLLPGLDRRAGAAGAGQGGAPRGAAPGLGAPLPQAPQRLPHQVPGWVPPRRDGAGGDSRGQQAAPGHGPGTPGMLAGCGASCGVPVPALVPWSPAGVLRVSGQAVSRQKCGMLGGGSVLCPGVTAGWLEAREDGEVETWGGVRQVAFGAVNGEVGRATVG